MKPPLHFAIVILVCCSIGHAAGLAGGKRFETSGYFSLVSYGENVSVQTDLGGGVNFLGYMNVSATINCGYRNYGVVTNDYLSVSAGKPLGPHEFRLGAVAGIYALWLSGYHATVPCAGGEAVYSFSLRPGLSLRVKERVCGLFDDRRALVSTATLIGVCFAFGS